MSEQAITDSPENATEEQAQEAAPFQPDGAHNESTDEGDNTVATQEAEAAAAVEALISKLQADLDAERERASDLLDKFQRSTAEFQNARRRQEKQMADEVERASLHVIKRLLPIMDDFGLAFQNVPSTTTVEENAWLNGFRQIQKKLQGILEDEGVTPVAVEGPFDPTRHEAVTSEPHESLESGQIIATLRMGYEHKGRVLRPALVRVAA